MDRNARFSIVLAAVLAAPLLTACSTDDNTFRLMPDRLALFKVTLSGGQIDDLEVVGVFYEETIHSIGRLHGEGELTVNLESPRMDALYSGSTLDPRRVFWDDFSGTSPAGGQLVSDEAVFFVAVPPPVNEAGRLELILDSPLGTAVPMAFNFNTSTRETSTAIFNLADGDLTFLGGTQDPVHAFLIVFIAHGYVDNLDVYDARVQALASGLLDQDWFSDHRTALSIWSMEDSAANSETDLVCEGGWEATQAQLNATANQANALYGEVYPRTVGKTYGLETGSPDLVVFLASQECRAFSTGPFILLGNDDVLPGSDGFVIAHEIAHSMGLLGDEYEEAGRACPEKQINTTPIDDILWKCLLPDSPYAETCDDGSEVGAYPPVASCDDIGRPCPQCMMNNSWVEHVFCPVCSNRLDLVFNVMTNDLQYADVDETCNGIDDNADGWVDEGCPGCGSTCTPEPEACGDGVDNDCDGQVDEGCTGCGNGVCDSPGENCSTCPDDCGACPVHCPDGTCESDETCTSCPQDCGTCPVPCPDGICETGETCESCPEDCGACGTDCTWFSCSSSCWPTGTSSSTACVTPPAPVDCSVHTTMADCDAHSADCAWYLCASSCWRRGTLDVVACNSCGAYLTVDQCNAQAPDCAWYACSSSCWPSGTANATACPDCRSVTSLRECDAHGTICAWYACSSTCWPEGTPNETACPDCSLNGTAADCDAHAPLCAWYACTSTCWRTGTPNDMACNACASRRSSASCEG
jgi:hypothetical protein